MTNNTLQITSLFARSLSLWGSRLVLWLMARLLICLGRAWHTWLLPVALVTAFNMAFTSAALALANAPAWWGWQMDRLNFRHHYCERGATFPVHEQFHDFFPPILWLLLKLNFALFPKVRQSRWALILKSQELNWSSHFTWNIIKEYKCKSKATAFH